MNDPMLARPCQVLCTAAARRRRHLAYRLPPAPARLSALQPRRSSRACSPLG